MLDPVTYHVSGSLREVDKDKYKQRILRDSNMLNTERLKAYGKQAFADLTTLVDLDNAKVESTKVEKSNTGILSQIPNFIPFGSEESEFYMGVVPQNGTRSFRRGYYKLLSSPELDLNSNFEKWQTEVLFNDGTDNTPVYKYKCNVGSLFNSLTVIGDLRSNKFFNRREELNKKDMFSRILNTVIYVSSAEMVNYIDFNSHGKEVLWFVW